MLQEPRILAFSVDLVVAWGHFAGPPAVQPRMHTTVLSRLPHQPQTYFPRYTALVRWINKYIPGCFCVEGLLWNCVSWCDIGRVTTYQFFSPIRSISAGTSTARTMKVSTTLTQTNCIDCCMWERDVCTSSRVDSEWCWPHNCSFPKKKLCYQSTTNRLSDVDKEWTNFDPN